MVELIKVKGRLIRFLVKRDGVVIGLLEKYANTASETHPWKAYKGIGSECTFLKSFYAEEGGKSAAIKAVCDATS